MSGHCVGDARRVVEASDREGQLLAEQLLRKSLSFREGLLVGTPEVTGHTLIEIVLMNKYNVLFELKRTSADVSL